MDINFNPTGETAETDLTKRLLDQVRSNNFRRIELQNYTEWLHSISPDELLDLFTAWGEYRGSILANGGRAQVHEIEGWIIDNLFVTPDEDWWVWKNILVDTTEYLDEPFMDTPIADIIRKVPAVERNLMGAVLDYGKALREGLLSIDNTNQRLRILYLTAAHRWIDWYNQDLVSMEAVSNAIELKVLYNMLVNTVVDATGSDDDETFSLEA